MNCKNLMYYFEKTAVGNKNIYLFYHRCCITIFTSEHILCKESIVIVKKFDFEILTDLYVLRSTEFIYAIFTVMHVCMSVCMCVCVFVYELIR